MKILFVTTEAVPYAKTGGLADVSGSLSVKLKEMGHDVRMVMPCYADLKCDWSKMKYVTDYSVYVNGVDQETAIIRTDTGNETLPVYFVSNHRFFNRKGFYGYEDDARRFIFFSRAVMEMCHAIGFQPDIIHCHDWFTGIIPVYLKTIYQNDPLFKNTGSVYTIHNLAYQGIGVKEDLYYAGLDDLMFTFDRLEFFGSLNLMKGGLGYADSITTVSPTYSQEIQTKQYGEQLEGLLKHRSNNLYGILNGVDYNIWSPENDPHLGGLSYNQKDLSGKEKIKKKYIEDAGLKYHADWPLLGIVSRLAGQKGFDILESVIDHLMDKNIYFTLLGTGEPHYERLFKKIASWYQDKAIIHIGFDNAVAHQIEAASDMFLMPSRYEPCGLNQIYSLKYGTLPVVRKTGGLADTVIDVNSGHAKPTGFVFEDYTPQALFSAVSEALHQYKNQKNWKKMVKNAMSADFSWEQSAISYVKVYETTQKSKTGR